MRGSFTFYTLHFTFASDSDRDGLGDYAEINETNTDPNDAYSTDGVYNDRLAVALGGLDPFSCPDGSTNSVLEHVFYSGTTNGAFAYPVSTDEIGVLRITVSGSGSGRLLVGDAVVPLVGFGTNTLLLAVGKGVRRNLRWDAPDGLDVALGSDDLMIGELPTLMRWKGWIAFPHTDAAIPCIHDLNAKRKTVTLVHGEEFAGLAAEWSCGSEDVDIGNLPPVSAEITGNFSTRESRAVSYTVDHPKRLTPSPLVVSQTLRFCPSLPEDDENGLRNAEEYVDEDEELWNCACASGGCTCCSGGWCHCHVSYCPCNSERDPSIGDADDQDAANAFSNIVAGVLQEKSNALYLYRANSDVVHLDVPTGEPPFCCGCPDHCHGNYAAKAFCSSRLEVLDGAGVEFCVTNASCDVSVHGVSPSRAFDDAPVLFVTNGVSYKRMDYTVLGVRFESTDGRPDMSVYNELSPAFGYPVHVCTNLIYADSIAIRTDILLDEGFIRLSIEGDCDDAGLWLPEWTDRHGTRHPAEPLLQGGAISVRHMSIEAWRGIARRYYDPHRVEIKVISSSPQSFSVRAEFASADGEGYVHDVALQHISSVRPALLPDYDRDGQVGASDARHNRNGGLLYFWTNRDTWRGDDAFAAYGEYSGLAHPWPITLPCNADDMVVNGRNDLVNLCPLAVDLSAFVSEWDSSRVVYRFFTGNPGAVRFVPTTTKWDSVGMIVSEDQKTVSGVDLHEATLMTTSLEGWHENGYELPAGLLAMGAEGAGVIAAEFASPGRIDMRVEAIDSESGYVLFESGVDVVAQDVHDMYRWLNLDYAIGAETDPRYNDRLLVGWPDAEHSDANVVFVHGYNVHPQEAWDWSQAMFKRLWWSGMDAGFTAVLWRGNESQAWVPGENCYATINYHQNVLNAFRTAETFAARVNALPGAKKFMIAHSLGNMLVSASRQFHGLQYEKYLMLNAAVPIEAYDPDGGISEESKRAMTPTVWRPYPDRVRSSHWYELFADTQGDERSRLTWKGLFRDVDNTVNFYSTRDEVVANGDGSWKWPLTRKFAWYNQEWARGAYLVSLSPLAGWRFSAYYSKTDVVGHLQGEEVYGPRRYTPAETFEISDESLKAHPFFWGFRDAELYGEGGSAFLQANPYVLWYALSHGIPAESFAAGANPVPKWDDFPDQQGEGDAESQSGRIPRNVDMSKDCKPKGRTESQVNWIHSYFIQNSYFDTCVLYEKLVEHIGSRKQKKGSGK